MSCEKLENESGIEDLPLLGATTYLTLTFTMDNCHKIASLQNDIAIHKRKNLINCESFVGRTMLSQQCLV